MMMRIYYLHKIRILFVYYSYTIRIIRKNDTPALSAPEFITISQSESPEGAVFTEGAMEWVPDDYTPPLREIQIPKEWNENPGKYSVQIQKFQIQRVKIIRAK
jgi:hypothetical protein